jgi:TonB-linked SusC/RagA family outer membrane protein
MISNKRLFSAILLLLCVSGSVLTSFSAFAQNRVINGKVIDENGNPLEGATITVKGTGKSTTSNATGTYSISVAPNQGVLVFSFVGLASQEIRIGSKNAVDVRLVSNSQGMEGVVVTALNIKRNPRSLGYSVAQLDGSKVNTVQTPNLVNALSGKVAGVDVGNIANGIAGTKRVVIRGATSLTGDNNPLWVIDGVPINSSTLGGLASNTPEGGYDYGDGLTGINPDDIESISVLKGNAAAALYGSRASNGVILVTTKSGKNAKGKTNVDVSTSLLIDKLYDVSNYQNIYGQSSINQLSGRELPTSADNAKGSDSWGHIMDGTPAPQFDGVIRPFSPVKNIYKDFFRTGSTITNTISLYGNSGNHDYRVSLSDLRNTDITPNSKFTRTSLNTKTHSTFGKMDVDLTFNYTYEKANNRPFIGGNHDNSLYSLLYLPNSISLESLKPGYDSTGREVLYTQGVSNPYYLINKEIETDPKNRMRGSLMLKYDVTNWLYVRGRLTRDYYLSKRVQYIPDGNASSSFPYNSPSNIGGIFNQRAVESSANEYEIMVGIDPDLKGKFAVNGFAGGNISSRSSSQLIESGNTFIVPNVYTFNNLKTKLPSTSESRRRTNSIFGSLELSYDKYLYLTLTGRTDWFSTLPLENNSLFYPAVSLSFVLSDALKLPAAISFAKLRASTAQVSGDTDPYQLDLSYSLDAFLYNNTLPLQLIGTSNIPNKKLKPLLSTDYEFGLDMDFFQSRVGFEATYYNRQIKDDIVRTAVSSTTGYSTAVLNVGKLKNSGIEILLRGTPMKNSNFIWDITATFTKNDNKIVALGDGVNGVPIVLATSKSGNAFVRLTEGERYGGIYGFSYLRDSATGQKIYDSRGFPVVNSTAKYLGSSTYDKMFGLTNTFTHKNLSLYLFVDGKFGADIYSETNATAYKNGKHMATLVGREDGLIADGLSQAGGKNSVKVMPDNLSSYYNQIGGISEQFIYDASFVKLREVALRYGFSNHALEKLRISNASISLVARNLLTIYKDKDLENVDPESNIAANNQQGIERLGFPPTRNYGLTIKFTIQ